MILSEVAELKSVVKTKLQKLYQILKPTNQNLLIKLLYFSFSHWMIVQMEKPWSCCKVTLSWEAPALPWKQVAIYFNLQQKKWLWCVATVRECSIWSSLLDSFKWQIVSLFSSWSQGESANKTGWPSVKSLPPPPLTALHWLIMGLQLDNSSDPPASFLKRLFTWPGSTHTQAEPGDIPQHDGSRADVSGAALAIWQDPY